MLDLEQEEKINLNSKDKMEHQGMTIALSANLQSTLEPLEKSISHTAGLQRKLILSKKSRVILRCNLNVEGGLVNGALGKVVDRHPLPVAEGCH